MPVAVCEDGIDDVRADGPIANLGRRRPVKRLSTATTADVALQARLPAPATRMAAGRRVASNASDAPCQAVPPRVSVDTADAARAVDSPRCPRRPSTTRS